jgi:hypothetical protein
MNGSTRRGPLVRVGDVIRVPEAHYLYGLGQLAMRVTEVGADLDRFPGLEWLRLRGVEIRREGTDGDARDVMVRVAALRDLPDAITRP